MPLLFKKKSEEFQPPPSIQLKELAPSTSRQSGSSKKHQSLTTYSISSSGSLSSSEDDEEIQWKKKKVSITSANNNTQTGHPSTSQPPVPDLIPLHHFEITLPDVLFSITVCLFIVLELVLDITLIVWHANTGHQWASVITTLFVLSGGVAMLSQFWGVSRDQLKRIYDHATCVRVSVNSFPWLFSVITSYHSATTSLQSHRNPSMMLHKHVKLQELTRSLLKIQTLAQAAPLSVTQLVVLLEDLDEVSFAKALTTTCSIVVNLTLMMVANLPLKSDTALEHIPRAAYSPYSRVFVGLRMICNFASRTMSLSLYLASFRCSVFHLISSSRSPVLPHLIPLAVLLVPRFFFALTHFIQNKLQTESSNHHQSFLDTTLMYVASVFFPFGDVLWLYVYVTLETIVFIVFGFVFGEIVGGEGCIGIGIEGIVYLFVFLVFFGFVPCLVPWIGKRISGRRDNNMRRGTQQLC